MPKKQGDKNRNRLRSLAEITHDLARSIAKKDARFQYFWDYVPVPKLMQPGGFFRSNKKTKVVFGGNKSTKTTAAVFEAVMVYTGIIPPSMHGVYAHEKTLRDISPGGDNHRPRRVRIIVQNYSKHWPETIRPLLEGDPAMGAEGMLPEAWSDWNPDERMYTGPDGSYLSIVACNPHEQVDPSTLRGPLIDHTMIDEINQEQVYTETLARGVSLKDGPRTVTCSYCPQEGFECWTFETFYKGTHNPVTKRPLPQKDQHPNIHATKVSMRDNPSISDSEREALVATYKPWEVAFRVDGEYSQRAANPFFNMEMLIAWEEEARTSDGTPYKVHEKEVDEEKGIFTGELCEQGKGQFNERIEPIWWVWELPKDGHRYVMTCDLSEGHKTSDNHSLDVWDATVPAMPRQVAQCKMREIKPGILAINAACMGNIYGGRKNRYCLMVPEKNNTGGGMFIERIRNYRNMYTRIRGGKILEKQTEDLGWHTDKNNKGPMLSDAYRLLQKCGAMKIRHPGGDRNYCPINSTFTLHELMGYEERIIRDRKLIAHVEWGARPGSNDDTVISMALAFRIIDHEWEKITPCRLPEDVVKRYDSVLENDARQTGRRAFSGMRRKKSLRELRKVKRNVRPHAR